MFEDLIGEFNPKAAGLALIGGFMSVYVQKNMTTGIFLKLLTFICTTVVCYIMVSFIANKQ